ncbi:MAG: LarC family nickel insertion protein [Actinomycetia bacterium]|nr:LarC family nickel insertion protein [Actinomycetes bacterium]
MHLHLDPVGGLAGDMFVAALIDTFPHLEPEVLAAVAALGIESVDIEVLAHSDGTLTGRRVRVTRGGQTDAEQQQTHGHDHSHDHQPFRTIRHLIEQAPLDPTVAARAIDIFSHLAAAEGRVHGIDPAEVTFHEVGAWDSIADIVAAAAAIVASGATTWSTGPLPLGGGTVRTAHGELPVPAPATVLLLEGLPVVDDGIPGERVTPTGAAILRSLAPAASRPPGAHQLITSGSGFGTRTLPGRSNLVRVLALEPTLTLDAGPLVGVIEFDIDDQPAEDLAVGLDRIREADGVLDVIQRVAYGKKGRLVTEVRILCEVDTADRVIDLCFLETTTLGVRRSEVERTVLSRSIHERHGVRVKTSRRPDGSYTAKADIDDLAPAGNRAGREAQRRLAEDRGRTQP